MEIHGYNAWPAYEETRVSPGAPTIVRNLMKRVRSLASDLDEGYGACRYSCFRVFMR